MIVECPGCQLRYDVTGRPPGTRARCRCGTTFQLPEPVTEADRMRCPGCGVAVGPADARCRHCHTALKIKACPRCFAKMFLGAKHCDQCGADVISPASANPDGTASTRKCPRCRRERDETLVARLVGETLLDECPSCHGVWLDGAVLERLLEERRQANSQALVSMASSAAAISNPGVDVNQSYVMCPDCDEMMNRENFGRRSGVIVDVCRAHGTWFDADELPRVIEFVRKGGLEESHRREMQRLKSEARAANRDALFQQQRDLRTGASPDAAHNANVFASMLGDIAGLF